MKAIGAWGHAGPARVPACSCLGAGEGFQGSLSAGSDAESPGESFSGFLLEELVVGDLKRRALRSRASPPHRFTAELLLILPSSLITGVRQYQIRSALATLPPPPSLEQRLNKLNYFFRLKKTPKNTQVKSSITKCSLGRFLPLRHTAKKIPFSSSKPDRQDLPAHRCLLISLPRKQK